MTTIKVGVAGLGYWGPNLARNFAGIPGCELAWLCDGDPAVLERVGASLPAARRTESLDDLLADPALDAIVLATPVPTHAELAERVLGAGKHCFVEKPLAQTVADAERAVAAAEAAGRTLMVGHLLEYHPGVAKLKEIADGGELGEIHYIYSNRLNLGKLRADENALWSLGAHDVSVLLHLAGEEPYEVEARGESYMRQGIEDVVFGFLRFPSGLAAHLHLSWLDPHKERRFTVVGSRRMATFDDMDLERKVTVYDKGFDQPAGTVGRVHHALGRHLEPERAQPRAAAAGVRALRRLPARGPHAGLRRPLRAARRARAGGAAGAARRLAPGAACSRLSWLRGCCWARACGSARACASAPTSSCTPGTVLGDGCEIQDGAILGKPPKLARHSSAAREAPPPLRARRRRGRLRAARSCSPARTSARGRSSATSPTCASARGSAPAA